MCFHPSTHQAFSAALTQSRKLSGEGGLSGVGGGGAGEGGGDGTVKNHQMSDMESGSMTIQTQGGAVISGHHQAAAGGAGGADAAGGGASTATVGAGGGAGGAGAASGGQGHGHDGEKKKQGHHDLNSIFFLSRPGTTPIHPPSQYTIFSTLSTHHFCHSSFTSVYPLNPPFFSLYSSPSSLSLYTLSTHLISHTHLFPPSSHTSQDCFSWLSKRCSYS